MGLAVSVFPPGAGLGRTGGHGSGDGENDAGQVADAAVSPAGQA